jgi:hypothetical protein
MLETLIAVLSYSPDLNYPAEVSFASWMKKGCASRTLPTSVGIKKGFASEELSTMNGLASSHCWHGLAMRGMAHRRAWSGPASTDWFVSHLAAPGVSAVLGCRSESSVHPRRYTWSCRPASGESPTGRSGKRPGSASSSCSLVASPCRLVPLHVVEVKPAVRNPKNGVLNSRGAEKNA